MASFIQRLGVPHRVHTLPNPFSAQTRDGLVHTSAPDTAAAPCVTDGLASLSALVEKIKVALIN
jgi:hypothetical protein